MAKRDWALAWFRLRRRYIAGLRRDAQAQLTLMGRAAALEFEQGARDPLDLLPESGGDELGRVVVERLAALRDDAVAAALDNYASLPDRLEVDIADLLDESGARMVGVNDELRRRVGRIVAEGVRSEATISDIAARIDQLVKRPSRSLTIARTEVSTVGNRTVNRAWSEAGVERVTISDGAGCGWLTHDDALKADGLVRTVAEFDAVPISHPNCQRTGFPILDR